MGIRRRTAYVRGGACSRAVTSRSRRRHRRGHGIGLLSGYFRPPRAGRFPGLLGALPAAGDLQGSRAGSASSAPDVEKARASSRPTAAGPC